MSTTQSVTEIVTAIGLMSGTSMDGIDAALIRTDGDDYVEAIDAVTLAYDGAFRARLRSILGGIGEVGDVEADLTRRHAEAVHALLHQANLSADQVAVIGFHGHTILHTPDLGRTWQIGDGLGLAAGVGIDVISDLRTADVAAGGQGAPLVPVFHRALVKDLPRPVAVLNIGGVANVTWIGRGTDDLLAFDTGPGNALIDDWCARRIGAARDEGGTLAAIGHADPDLLDRLMSHPYFAATPPKSLDRDAFGQWAMARTEGLSDADGAAVLTEFTTHSIAAAARWFPEPVERWVVAGGGRYNATLMAGLRSRMNVPVLAADALGWDGDALEAQAFAYLAVRSLGRLPITYPGTTGVAVPHTGGRLNFATPREMPG
ncbi:MAG: anhydro-N-acetylmuramic acid kinase [Alphaproteobacteria bacterium]|nr:anhydro-N-acetylmuramic acid kinase [Alphaproteobacteria bacterium]